jgi:hypothetical protein
MKLENYFKNGSAPARSVAQVSQHAVSSISKSAGFGNTEDTRLATSSGLETLHTADLEVCATLSSKQK